MGRGESSLSPISSLIHSLLLINIDALMIHYIGRLNILLTRILEGILSEGYVGNIYCTWA